MLKVAASMTCHVLRRMQMWSTLLFKVTAYLRSRVDRYTNLFTASWTLDNNSYSTAEHVY